MVSAPAGNAALAPDGGDLPVNHNHEAGRDDAIALTVEHMGGFEDVSLIGGGERDRDRHEREEGSMHQ